MSDISDQARREYYNARKENIKDSLDCSEVLEHFGVDLLYKSQEVQYRCPLHGDGFDGKKSARYYPRSDDTYCWGCQQYRDHIGLTMDFKGCSFSEALHYLEETWDIESPSIYEFVDPSKNESDQGTSKNSVEEVLDEDQDPLEDLRRKFQALGSKIDRFRQQYRDDVDRNVILKLYHGYDYLMYRLERGSDPQTLESMAQSIRSKINRFI